MILSVDTSVAVNSLRGHGETRARLRRASRQSKLVVSSIAYDELIFGALLSQHPEINLLNLRELLTGAKVEDYTEDDAWATATMRAVLERQGKRLESYDAMIAGQALGRGWAVATANLKDFGRVPGLQVLDWSV